MPAEEDKRLPVYFDEPSQTTDSKNDTKHQNKEQCLGSSRITSYEWTLLAAIFLVAYAVRVYKLERTVPHGVRYNDDTRALPKLLAMLMDMLPDYADSRHLTTTRLFATLLGALTAPLAYLTTRQLECHPLTALLASLFITFDNGLITQSRYIFPDSTQFFFTTLTLFFWFAFAPLNKRQSFSQKWWSCLAMTGLSLGAVISSKWTGMFTAATIVIGIYYQVVAVKDRKMRHLRARVLCLVVLPALFYLIMQRVYGVAGGLDLSTEDDPSAIDVSIGSTVTIRPYKFWQGGPLYTNNYSHPSGRSNHQQVTLYYAINDENSKWIITNTTADAMNMNYTSPTLPFTHLFHSTRIRLLHAATLNNLHSHRDYPLRSKPLRTAFEVTAREGMSVAGDENDNWTVEVMHGDRGRGFTRFLVRTTRTVLVAFRHSTGCYLYSSGQLLGRGRLEVSCTFPEGHDLDFQNGDGLWYFESSEHPAEPITFESDYSSPEGGVASATSNMKTTENWSFLLNRGAVRSSPPLSLTPNAHHEQDFRIASRKPLFALNPVVWWGSTLGVSSYLLFILSLISRLRIGYEGFTISPKAKSYLDKGGFILLAWAMHYVPYKLMDRRLFIYDYFPALYISLLLLFMGLDTAIVCTGLRMWERTIVVLGLLVALLVGYGSVARYTYEVQV